MTANPQDVNPVIERFAVLRGEILDVVDAITPLVENLGPFRPELEARMDFVRDSVDASRLNVVVIGAEGHGKSTLINAIVGQDLSPEAAQHPGTVAPVHFEYGDHPEARRFVQRVVDGGDAVWQECPDEATFNGYLLQELNQENEKRVVAAVVRLDHPMLANGLRLVDMPGIEGVSAKVSGEAARFVDQQAHAVLVVCRDRAYGPLARVARSLTARSRLDVDACVNNFSGPFFDKDEDELRVAIENQRTITRDKIDAEQGTLDLTPERIFVLDLLTVSGKASPRFRTESVVHDAEVARFRRRLADVVRERGVDRVIFLAAGDADECLMQVEAHLSSRRSMLEVLRRGGDEAAAVRAALESACDAAETAWDRLVAPDVVRSLADVNFAELSSVLRVARDQVLEEVTRQRADLERAAAAAGEVEGVVGKASTMWESRLSKSEAKDIHDAVNDVLQDRQGDVEAAQKQILEGLLDRYIASANSALDDVYRRVPALRTDVGHHHLDVPGLLAFRTEALDSDEGGDLLKLATAGAGAGVGGMVAGGGGIAILVGTALGPFTAAVAGSVGTAVLGWAVVDWVRGGKRAGVVKTLRKMQESLANLDLGPESDLRTEWDNVVAALASSVGEYFQGRLASVRALGHEGDSIVVAREVEGIDESLATAADLRRRLEEISDSAVRIG
jgi:hypothetical protein